MWHSIYIFFSYVVFFYTMTLIISNVILMILSLRAQRLQKINMPDDDMLDYLLRGTPLTPHVSVIASAYNEHVTILDNVNSMLGIKYPSYDIIIVNDASTDNTMEILIDEFKLKPVPFANSHRVRSKKIINVYRSTEPEYDKIIVVDKEHAGAKCDGINAGINISTASYFINTDVDCIVDPMAISRMMWLVLNSHTTMMGVSATMLMSNGCTIKDGRVTEAAVSLSPLPMWQQLEYMRSFLLGKMGWSAINALPNISGGFGLFNTEVVIKSGGYSDFSFAEDMDMLMRMVTYMVNSGHEFKIAQVPQVCCWTEGPFTLSSIYRQRTRWARGMCEIVSNHRRLFFNPHYGPIGGLTLPYIFIFEFIAPILEFGGILFTIWLVWIGRVNWRAALVIFSMIYMFAIALTFVVLLFDYNTKSVPWKNRFASYCKLFLAGITEPIFYHPIITFCNIVGYFRFLANTTAEWVTITRKGSGEKRKKNKKQKEENVVDDETPINVEATAENIADNPIETIVDNPIDNIAQNIASSTENIETSIIK